MIRYIYHLITFVIVYLFVGNTIAQVSFGTTIYLGATPRIAYLQIRSIAILQLLSILLFTRSFGIVVPIRLAHVSSYQFVWYPIVAQVH